MNVQVEIVTGISQKTGKEYVALKIIFSNGFEKLVFPKGSAETIIFKQLMRK